VYERRKEYGKAEDILYSMASLVTISVLNNDDLSAQDILDTAENFYKNEIQSGNNQPILKRNMGYMYLNMGAINQYKKQFEKAIFYLNKSEPYIEDFPFDLSAIGSRLAECYLGLNNLEKAEDIANKNLKVKNLSEQEKIYNYKVLENVYKAKGLNSKLLKIKDSLILISSGSSTSKIIKSLNNFETEVQLANSARELNESKIRYNTYLFVLIICSIILFFSLATIRVNYNYQKEKGNRLEAEKQLISSKLDQKNRELVSKSNFILQRNEYLKKIKTKLESSESTANNLQSASYELNSVINSEKSYKDFDKMFVNVYPDFYSKLNKIAELSSTDLRLASYIKMNHTNSEIAIISGVSSRTIESQRYRLSKKLNLDKDQSLNSFLMSI
jgi:DNA-binding CsgD family transcriptional regulator